MTDLVEHVARALDPDIWVIWDGKDQWRKIHHNHWREASLQKANTAIRSVLEYARDNVSHQQIADGWAQLRRANLPHLGAGPGLQEAYRAMLDALLAELDGTESEVGK